jgi:Transposase IS4
MDNLYLSAKFAKACYTHKLQIHIAGVTRKSGRGLPACVVQQEVNNKRQQMAVRGTVKAAVLKGDRDCPDLLAVSVYDTKPVHFISMIAENIDWIAKCRLVYDAEAAKMMELNYLRLNMVDDYNMDMGHVDLADQLRGNYRMDKWLRQYKWWWSIWLWAIGVLTVNAYVFYQQVMMESGIPRREWMSHYEFRKQIALAWVSKDEPSLKQRRKANLPENLPKVAGKRKEAPIPSSARRTRTKVATDRAVKQTPASITAVDKAAKDSSSKKGKACAVSDASLNSSNGPFARRLDRDAGHWLTEVPNRPKCALHRWACGNEMSYRLNVFACSFCMVNLCIDCFRIFHTEPGPSMIQSKEKFAAHFESKRAAKKAA